jgi:hypothetical protein
MTEQQDKGLPRDDTGRVTSDYEPTQLEIDTCRNAICREFGNNGTDGYYIRILKAIYAVAPVPPSVEALRIEADAMERALSLQETHLDKHVATIATLEATNAAQAEQLATACLMLSVGFGNAQQFAKICDQVQQEQEGDGEYGTAAAACAQRIREAIRGFAALQSSIPPEPQAGVELTDALIAAEAVRKSLAEKYQQGIDTNSADMGGNCDWARLEGAVKVVQALRALNQRQAVKAEPIKLPAKNACFYCGEDHGNLPCPGQSPIAKPKPLSAAQRVPEGMVLIPGSALRWLFGEEGKFECPPERYFRGHPAPFWWRSVFRDKLSAAPEQAESKEGKE